MWWSESRVGNGCYYSARRGLTSPATVEIVHQPLEKAEKKKVYIYIHIYIYMYIYISFKQAIPLLDT